MIYLKADLLSIFLYTEEEMYYHDCVHCAVPSCIICFFFLEDCNGKDEWLNIIFKKVHNNFSPTFTVCVTCLRAGCFVNLSQCNSGFAKRLLLKELETTLNLKAACK